MPVVLFLDRVATRSGDASEHRLLAAVQSSDIGDSNEALHPALVEAIRLRREATALLGGLAAYVHIDLKGNITVRLHRRTIHPFPTPPYIAENAADRELAAADAWAIHLKIVMVLRRAESDLEEEEVDLPLQCLKTETSLVWIKRTGFNKRRLIGTAPLPKRISDLQNEVVAQDVGPRSVQLANQSGHLATIIQQKSRRKVGEEFLKRVREALANDPSAGLENCISWLRDRSSQLERERQDNQVESLMTLRRLEAKTTLQTSITSDIPAVVSDLQDEEIIPGLQALSL
ncbi:hypothetical protein CYLTODRAFT_456484 [Cylindrobasidium torrendii FP15055 ss-10]|uniref:Uncharacterized protein n=1 Tax=Cylindrobasidium torrendii FP15055 ss-10 TaxID=1314674 RepID=A0A0D7B509_9AGAR|nr:hypothetical protein CYLTODRAFT_456484 [Cylindrobasidium torrendii FP15055 ss-10]